MLVIVCGRAGGEKERCGVFALTVFSSNLIRRRNKCKSTDLLAATNNSFSPNSPGIQDSGTATSVQLMDLRGGFYVNTTKNVEVVLQQMPVVLNLSKWQRVFGHVLVEPSQILIQETIGEGDSLLVYVYIHVYNTLTNGKGRKYRNS